ncbi:MaoC/PaaZ C-terminal domain-containing protein [Amycolatopsis jejuensis]|uniref:MaoC/PaaZ C-terminal domain-containing protein n=1 Tax=Amycolatopsis jejuensis TaxID=330084 RepID=UPI000523F3C6|nr:MaoC/PaaZ C-terminal domain-containing protein [Amycolatopsis jejuensis]
MWFEDFIVGEMFETVARTVTEADVVTFSGLSGDMHPLHTDAEYAKATPFGQRVVHGALVLSLAVGLRGRTGRFDDTLIAFLEIRSWQFRRPVFIGDTVHARNEVVEARASSKPGRGVVVQRVEVVNQEGEVVQSGDMVTLVRQRP